MDHSMKKLLNQEATAGCERAGKIEQELVEFRAIGTMPIEVSCNNELVLKGDYKSKTIWFVMEDVEHN
ncbi:hypothetical protein ACFX13_047238 [Malus domestica]